MHLISNIFLSNIFIAIVNLNEFNLAVFIVLNYFEILDDTWIFLCRYRIPYKVW